MDHPIDRESLERDCDISFFVAGGPGGQHRNKVATGVRLLHRPSGLSVSATERRSQAANREVAYARMAERLRVASIRRAPRIATAPSRSSRLQRRAVKERRGQIKRLRRRTSGEE